MPIRARLRMAARVLRFRPEHTHIKASMVAIKEGILATGSRGRTTR